MQEHSKHKALPPLADLAMLAGLVALGLGLRLAGIARESFWWDEYASMMHLGAPDLWSFLKLSRTLDPGILPAYFILEYLWTAWISSDLATLRYLSIIIGLLTIPMVYLAGRAFYGRTAGLVAALCVTLSPIHTFHAQGIRMYVLMTFLAAASVCTFANVVSTGRKRWWLAHVFANFLLAWTHPFALLLPVAEGAWLALFRLRGLRRTILWGALHFLAFLPLAIYLSTITYWPADQASSWFRIPSAIEILSDIFADDVISLTYQLRLSEGALGFLPSSLARLLVTIHPLLDTVLAALFISGVLWAGWKSVSRLRAAKSGEAPDSPGLSFLILWLLLPVALLYVASMAWRPCIFPRYTLHCSLALYIIAGGAIAQLPRKIYQVPAVCGLAFLLLYQMALLHPGPQRTDWQTAARIVKEESNPHDAVLVQVSIWQDVFLFNAGDIPNPVSSAESAEVLAHQARFLANALRDKAAGPWNPGNLWILVKRPYFDVGTDPELDEALEAQDLRAETRELQGIEHVVVYRLPLGIAKQPVASIYGIQGGKDFTQAYGNLAMALAEKGHREAALLALAEVFKADPATHLQYGNLREAIERGETGVPQAKAVRALLRGYGLRENGHIELAANEFREAVEHDPVYAIGHMELGMALARIADFEGALPHLQKALELEPTYVLLYSHLVDVIASEGDASAALEAMQYLLEAFYRWETGDGPGTEQLMKQALETDASFGLVLIARGSWRLEQGDAEGCLEDMYRAFEVDATTGKFFKTLVKALLEDRDYEAAAAEIERLEDMGIEVPAGFMMKLVEETGGAAPDDQPPAADDPNR